MTVYSELVLDLTLKRNTPIIITRNLEAMESRKVVLFNNRYADYPLFEVNDNFSAKTLVENLPFCLAEALLTKNGSGRNYLVTFRASTTEIASLSQKIFGWVAPYCQTGSENLEYCGYLKVQNHNEPILTYLYKDKL